jgi:hypothetical protein
VPDAQLSVSTTSTSKVTTDCPDEKDLEETFDFRLFAPPSLVKLTVASSASIQPIRIPPSPPPILPSSSANGAGAFVVPHRSKSCYFADPDRMEKNKDHNSDAEVAASFRRC